MVGKQAVRSLLECFLVHLRYWDKIGLAPSSEMVTGAKSSDQINIMENYLQLMIDLHSGRSRIS